jgi:ABC-type transporter Mla subunit MlaD
MAVQEVRSAGADTGKFLSDIAEENPTMRTVQQDVGAIWNAAENVYNATRQAASQVGPAIEEGVETVEKACEGGPACIP